MLFRDKRIFCFQIITKVWGIRNKYSEESYPMHLIWIIWESESWVRILLWCMDCWWLCLCLEWAECLLTSDWSHSDHAHHSPESAAVVSGRSQSRSQSTGVKQRQLSKDQSLVQTNFDNYQWFFKSVLEMFYFVNFLSLEQYHVHFQNWVKIERQFKFFRIFFNKKAYSSSSLKSHFLESLLISWCVFQSVSKVFSLSHYSGHTNPYGPIIRWLILCLWGVLVIDINNSKVWWTPRLCLNKTSQYKVVIRLISTDSNITNSNPGCWSDSAIITNNFHQPQPHTLHQTNYYSLTFYQAEPSLPPTQL